MRGTFKAWLITLPLGIATGVALGQATAASLRITPAKVELQGSFADRAFERGRNWAHSHGVFDTRDCPEPDQYFLSGCVTGSDTRG
jgi:hypothetical protein